MILTKQDSERWADAILDGGHPQQVTRLRLANALMDAAGYTKTTLACTTTYSLFLFTDKQWRFNSSTPHLEMMVRLRDRFAKENPGMRTRIVKTFQVAVEEIMEES